MHIHQTKEPVMKINWIGFALLALLVLPAWAEEEKDDGLTEVIASQDISVRRGTDKAVKEKGIHPKKISRKEKHQLDRFALIRFDNEDFGKDVRAAGLRLKPVIFGDHKNKPMRFRVYGVTDGDEQDEKFTEKDYDPNAEDTIVDRRVSTVIDRKQVSILGSFSTEKDEEVLFSTRNFLAFVRADTNGTVTFVLIRETESGLNSTFAPRQSEDGPRLVMKLDKKASDEDAAAEPAPVDAPEEAPDAAEAPVAPAE